MSRTRSLLTALGACLALAGVLSPPALAGRYEVLACGGDGITSGWQLRHDGIGGYTTGGYGCPGGQGQGTGIFVRNTGHPTVRAPGLTNASSFLSAPAGTAIVALSGRADMNATQGWQSGIFDFSTGHWLWCGPGCASTHGQWPSFAITGLWSSQVGGLVICGSSSCGRSGSGPAGIIGLSDVVATLEDTWRPSLSLTGGSLRRGGWLRRTNDLSWDASDNTGIRRLGVLVDGVPFESRERACDPHSPTPCPNGGGRLSLDTATFTRGDGGHAVRVEAYDSGGNVTSVEQSFRVDNTAPDAPLGPALAGGTGWRASNSFALTWRNRPQNASPITGVRFNLCPSSSPAVNGRACVAGARDGANIKSLTNLRVPRPGAWTLRLWLRDQAGNEDPARSISVAGLKLDNEAPTLAFAAPEPDDPTLVLVKAADAGSGLAHTEIELRRQGASTWTSVPTRPTSGGFASRIDDEHLADGTYELRARAVDAAGNERSTGLREDGGAAKIALPVRIKTRLSVGKVKRIRARGARGKRRTRRVLIVKPRARFGRTTTLHGRLTTPGGNPLVDSEVEVSEQVELPGAIPTRIASLRTSRTGRFTFKALRGPSRILFFRYGGTGTIRGRTTAVDLRIEASSTLRTNRRAAHNGEYVTFRGRVRGRPLPPAGKLVELQVFTRGQWRTFAQPRASARTGRWSYAYRFEAVRGRERFRFRARIRKETGFPYDLGVSRQKSVTVLGL
jgi:hypothetical protein